MAKAPPRKAKAVTKTPKAPTVSTTPEPSAFDRMRELTRRIVGVPRAEVVTPTKRRDG